MNHALRTLYMIYLARRPFFLNHKINIACDSHCRYCDLWKIEEDPAKLMSVAEIESLLDKARAAGMVSYSVWGGEPLLREDAPAILAAARQRGFYTTLSTNGSLLAERAAEFLPHTSLFIVSLDGLAAAHDGVRCYPGLFGRALEGIRAVIRGGGKVRVFFNVNKLTLPDIKPMAGLAREEKFSLYFSPVIPIAGCNEKLMLGRETEREVFQRVLDLKREGYPIVNLASYLRLIRDGRETPCRFPQYHIYVDWDGTLYTCDLGSAKKLGVWGNAREVRLTELFGSAEFKAKVLQLINCNACRLSCGEIGYGSPLLQFPARAYYRLRHERKISHHGRG